MNAFKFWAVPVMKFVCKYACLCVWFVSLFGKPQKCHLSAIWSSIPIQNFCFLRERPWKYLFPCCKLRIWTHLQWHLLSSLNSVRIFVIVDMLHRSKHLARIYSCSVGYYFVVNLKLDCTYFQIGYCYKSIRMILKYHLHCLRSNCS